MRKHCSAGVQGDQRRWSASGTHCLGIPFQPLLAFRYPGESASGLSDSSQLGFAGDRRRWLASGQLHCLGIPLLWPLLRSPGSQCRVQGQAWFHCRDPELALGQGMLLPESAAASAMGSGCQQPGPAGSPRTSPPQ